MHFFLLKICFTLLLGSFTFSIKDIWCRNAFNCVGTYICFFFIWLLIYCESKFYIHSVLLDFNWCDRIFSCDFKYGFQYIIYKTVELYFLSKFYFNLTIEMICRLILTRVTLTSEILAFLPWHQSIPSPHPSEVGHDASEFYFKDPASIGESLKTIH